VKGKGVVNIINSSQQRIAKETANSRQHNRFVFCCPSPKGLTFIVCSGVRFSVCLVLPPDRQG
jgi:hypothetical protein